jgi:predicted RNA-binding protein with RPS1 domain
MIASSNGIVYMNSIAKNFIGDIKRTSIQKQQAENE